MGASPDKLLQHPTQAVFNSFSINCKGDACIGDTVLFQRAVYVGEYPNSVKSHDEQIIATIEKESYGQRKQQHTFTLLVHWSSDGRTGRLIIKGRNLYRKGTLRQPWEDEASRKEVLAEKHSRGGQARRARGLRRANSKFRRQRDG